MKKENNIKPIDLELSDTMKQHIRIREYYTKMLEESASQMLGVPMHRIINTHYQNIEQ